MFSFFIPFALLFFAFTSHAISGRVSIKPRQPMIVAGDVILKNRRGEHVVQGPWFKAFYGITNHEERTITVQTVRVTVASVEGHEDSFEFELAKPTQLKPGETVQVQDIYVGPLPASTSTKYAGSVSFEGWFGTVDAPEEALTEHGQFQTQ